jgi:amino acid transporter
LATFSALSFAELAGRYPRSAGEAAYVREGFRVRWLSILTGLLVVLIGVISTASLLRGLAGYATALLPVGDSAAILLTTAILAALAAWGIRESVTAAAIITLIEIGGLLIVITTGLWQLPAELQLPALLPDNVEWPVVSGILAGAFLAFYAMIGFEDMVNVAEEVKDVRHTMTIAIVLTLIVTTLLYMAVAWVALAWVPPAELAATDAPLARVYETITGNKPVLITGIAVLAVVNGGLILMIMASRVLYGMSRMQELPGWFGRVNARTQTPINAILFSAAIIVVLALLFPLEQLARTTAGIALAVFSLVNLSLVLVKLRGEQPPEGAMTVPFFVPVAGFLVSAGFITWELVK